MRAKKVVDILYLMILGIGLGAMIGAIFAAPVLFRAPLYVPELDISLYQSGILMTQIFLKLNNLLLVVGFFVLIYEVAHVRQGKFILSILGALSVVLIVLFVFHFTAFILEAQLTSIEATQTEVFDKMHHQSTLAYKVLLGSLMSLFFGRLYMYQR